MKIVDTYNPIPKYLQISAWLKELIETGRYRKGEQLPSEVELARMCDVTRTTVRQAIAELTAKGPAPQREGDRHICVRTCACRIKTKARAHFKHHGFDAGQRHRAKYPGSRKTG